MKRLLSVAVTLLFAASAFAQPDFSALKYGVRGGVGIGSVDTTFDDESMKNQEGNYTGVQFTVGGFAELPLWKSLNLTAEVNFERTSIKDHYKRVDIQGSGLAAVHVFSDITTEFPISYVHIPVLAKLNFLRDALYVEAGPQLGLLVGKVNTYSKVVASAGGMETTTETTTDDTDHFKKTQWALVFGWGFNLHQVSAGLRAAFGVGDIQADAYKVDGCNVRHTDVQLVLRYSFK